MSDLVTVNISEGIADIRFNRPDKHNSLTLEMFDAIIAAAAALADNPAVRVAVLSGNGPSFCAGLDISIMAQMLKGPAEAGAVLERLLARDGSPDNRAQRAALAWKDAAVPVIAALHGAAFGGGCQIALGADMRIAAPDTRLSVMEIKYGLIPDMGLTQTLPELVRLDIAKELTLSGRIVDAEEALLLGLVTRVSAEPLVVAMDIARSIAGRAPSAVRAAKRLLNEAWRADARTGLALEETLQRTLLGSPEQVEAVTASMHKREPRFATAGGGA
jgi:enoyl-CoA hydratase/carnithine racemase